MKQLLGHYRPFIPHILLVILVLFGQVLAELALPGLMAGIIDRGIIPGDLSFIYRTGGLMLAVALVGVLCAIAVSYLSSRIASGASRSIRLALFSRVTEFSSVEFDHFTTASLITRSTSDIQILQNTSVMIFRMAFFAPLMGIGALIGAISTSPGLSWTIGVAILLVLIIMGIMMITTVPKFKLLQQLLDRLTRVTGERLQGVLVIRAFNRQPDEQQRFDDVSQDLTRLNVFVNRMMSLLMPGLFLVMNLSSLLIVWVGSRLIDLGQLQVGSMMAFIQYSMSVIMSFLFIAMMFIMIPRAMVSAQRIGEVITREEAIRDPEHPQTLSGSPSVQPRRGARLEFRGVSFRYPGAPENVLTDISFTAEPGKTTAFIGSTGSGKSTIIHLIPRFYDATEGEILLDGVNIQHLPQKLLRSQLGLVSQKAVLFSGTIGSNIGYGRPGLPPEELERAAQLAQAMDFIVEKPLQMDDPISQGGSNVSGGQRQRLSIARALAVHPRLLLFDDSFSALDFKTDRALRQALADQVTDTTILIVGQRINTIRHADQIIVLEEGIIAGIGTHQELMQCCPVYQEIAMSQLREEDPSITKGGDHS
jgi:ATP-binding cassette subfamily B protein